MKDEKNLQQRAKKMTLNISEIFYSIEGEGIRIGEPTLYIRVIGCPHRCSWCDTPYSIGQRRDPIKKYVMTINQIVDKIDEFVQKYNIKNTVNVEFTGGSPDWFPDEIGTLMETLREKYKELGTFFVFQISGGIYDMVPSVYYTSRQLLEMTDLNAFDCKPAEENIPFVIPIKLIRPQDEIKFLIKDEESYQFVKDKIKYFNKELVECKYIITTVTNNKDDHSIVDDHVEKLRYWTERILNDVDFPKDRVKILPREHVLLWGNKRGV